MPLPHLPGLGHGMNPIPYPPQLNFPPPPIMAPIPLGVPPPPYSLHPPPPGSPLGSAIDFDNMSIHGSSTTSTPSVQGCAPHPWVLTGGFHLPDLTSLMDTVAYEMWKNTIGFFHLSGHTDELIMPIAYQSIKGDVALDIVTHWTSHEPV